MKKTMILSLLLALCLLAGCAMTAKTPTDGTTEARQTESGAEKSDDLLPAPEEEANSRIPDFTVTTVDGAEFHLYEVMEEKDLVFINLFATWCPPCAMEFPYLEEAYADYQDRVAVIALSVDSADTDEMLADYAAGKELSFPVASGADTELIDFFRVSAIPTSALIDSSGNVLWTEVGAQSSKADFTELFDQYLVEESEREVVYSVRFQDQYGLPVSGCVINFCTDEACTPVVSNEKGVAEFRGKPFQYHLQIVSVPEGYAFNTSQGYYTEARAQNLVFVVERN